MYGFFQRFRPTGAGVEAAVEVLPHSDQLLKRLMTVYAATAEGSGREDAGDAYFIVRRPLSSTAAELEYFARTQIASWREMALAIGDEELAAGLKIQSVEITTAPPEPTREGDAPTVRIYDAELDWHAGLASSCTHDYVLREAFYSVACNYTLARYLTWPWYQHSTNLLEPFEAYFQLWRRGADLRQPKPGMALLHVAGSDHRKDA